MKKILLLLLILSLSLSVFVGCEVIDTVKDTVTGVKDTVTGWFGGETTDSMSDAIDFLNSKYEADNGKVLTNGLLLISQIPVGEEKFTVTWTTDNAGITIEKDGSFYNLILPTKNETEVEFTLTATVTSPDGSKTETRTYTRKIGVIDNSDVVTAPVEGVAYKLYMKNGAYDCNFFVQAKLSGGKYYETSLDASEAAEFYVEKVDGGYNFYTTVSGAKKYVHPYVENNSKKLALSDSTDTVWVYDNTLGAWTVTIDSTQYVLGTYSTYTTVSISEGSKWSDTSYAVCFGTKEAVDSWPEQEAATIYATNEEAVNAAYTLAAGKILSLGHEYTITGVVTTIPTAWSDEYENITVTIVVGGMTDKPVECFRLSGTGAKNINVGDTVEIKGMLSTYAKTGKVQITYGELLNGKEDSSSGEASNLVPSDITSASQIEANKAYKLYLHSTAKNANYFLTGSMSGYYMATETSVSSAADVYVEIVDGGYKLYINGDSKQYLAVAKSADGAHTNAVFNTTGSVFVFNEEYKTFVTTLSDGDYFLGTYGNYVTFGASAVSNLGTSYVGTLCTLVEGGASDDTGSGDNTGSDDNTGDNDQTVTDPIEVTITEAIAIGSAATSGVYGEQQYILAGTIVEIQNSTYGNVVIKDSDNVTILIYGIVDGEVKFGEMSVVPMVGDTITVQGPLGNHYGTPQMKNATLTSHTAHDHAYTTLSAKCDVCGEIAATHTSCNDAGSDGVCDDCGSLISDSVLAASLSFATTDSRVSQTTEQQVWSANGITFTNDKSSSTSNIIDSKNPVRLYKNSSVTIEYTGMKKIVFECNTSAYATALESSISADVTISVDGSTVTIIFAEAVDSFTISLTGGQVRVNSIDVYA